jgi:translation initiation factor IF-2
MAHAESGWSERRSFKIKIESYCNILAFHLINRLMQIPKSLLLACTAAAAVCSTSLCAGADSEAQSKAREALRQKLSELDTVPQQNSEAVNKAREALRQKMVELDAEASKSVQPSKPAAPVAPPPPVQPVMAMPKAMDSEAIAKAREALRQKMTELDAQAAPGRPDSAEVAKAREALRQKMVELEQQQPVSPTTAELQKRAAEEARARKAQKAAEEQDAKAKAAAAAPAPVAKPPPAPVQAQAPAKVEEKAPEAEPSVKKKPARGEFSRLPGPDLPLSAEKQQKLAELLKKYRADEITPEQYHSQRAKILAEP